MKADLLCRDARILLSARLDGEVSAAEASALDQHLAGCSACREHQVLLAGVRRTLRLQAAPHVPDIAPHVIERLRRERHTVRWRAVARTAGVAAVAAALAFGALVLPQDPARQDVATAAGVIGEVRAAGRAISTFEATFSIVEHGWHPRVPTRRFTADVWFDAPEHLRLELSDLTDYPGKMWPANDVRLVARPGTWTLSEPVVCPVAALPHCAPTRGPTSVAIVDRQPFDGSSPLPTDMIVPLETLISSDGVHVIGPDNVAGRGAQQVSLSYASAAPLVQSFQPGGSWRAFHPLDVVTVWLDTETWIPLKFEVRAGDSPRRDLWQVRAGATGDRPGKLLLQVEATSFDTSGPIAASTFESDAVTRSLSGGFILRPFASFARLEPGVVAGLDRYRAGIAPGGRRVLTYSDGLAWLKVIYERRGGRGPGLPSEEVSLGDGGTAYYEPSGTLLRRRLDLFAKRAHVYIETNLPRATLLDVGESLPVIGRRVAGKGGARRLAGSDPWSAVPFALAPGSLPAGYDVDSPTAAYKTRTGTKTTLTVHYLRAETEFQGNGIRITQAYPVRALPPSSRSFLSTSVGDSRARWSIERSELEWIDDGVYRAVATPNFDLRTALEIARSLHSAR